MKLALTLAAVLSLVAFSASANLVTDGGFDSALTVVNGGNAMSTYNTGTWYTAGTAGWNQCWKIVDGSLAYGTGNTYNMSAVQILAMPAAGDYKFEFDYTSGAAVPPWGHAAFIGYTNGTNNLNLTSYPFDSKSTVDGTSAARIELAAGQSTPGHVSYDLTITADVVAANQFLVIGFHGDGPGLQAVDNIGFTAIPEPATMSVLALGALGLIRRRR